MAKLVEILARELEAWPDDTPCITQDPDGYSLGMLNDELGDLRFDERLGEWIGICAGFMEIMDLSEDHRTAIVTRAEWQAAVDALKAKEVAAEEWDGVGLPPVGIEIEFSYPMWGCWLKGRVLCYGKQMIFMEQESSKGNGKFEGSMNPDGIMFRPIRTPEQIAAEEREKFIDELIKVTCIRRGEAGLIYDAGYRKQEQK